MAKPGLTTYTAMPSDDPQARPSDKVAAENGPQSLPPPLRVAWRYEALAWAAALLVLLAVALMLWVLNNRPLRDLVLGLQLTTLVSIGSTLIEGLVAVPLAGGVAQDMYSRLWDGPKPLHDIAVFNSASHGGLMGNLKLLGHKHSSPRMYLAALTGLLALILNPALQETIQYKSHDGRTTLPRCEGSPSPYTQATPASLINTFRSAAAWGGQFVRGGAYDRSLQQLSTDCITGNCTYPPYNSFGVCSHCNDLTDQVSVSCDTKQPTSNQGCTYKLPNGLLVSNQTSQPQPLVEMNTSTALPMIGLASYGDATITELTMIKSDYYGAIHAAECAMYWCIRSYESATENNIFRERVTAEWHGKHAVKVPGQGDDSQYTDYVFSPPPAQWADFHLSKETNFTVDGFSRDTVSAYFNSALCQFGCSGSDCVLGYIWAWWSGTTPDRTSMGSLLANMTMEMTDNMRLRCDSNLAVVGVAKNLATILDVQWLWMIYPIIVVMFAGVFLMLEIRHSRGYRHMIWKESVLPLLFFKPSAELEGFWRNRADNIKEVDQGSKDEIGQIRQVDERWVVS